ncbi:MAG: helix-turn-helix domain-containing protein [Firmicutes bacterium]|nr:helix-turn-helix domain-containing protein [Bacillota bacterium]
MFIGERLAELRKDRGLRQKELADKLNVKEKTISAYENDVTAPSDRIQEEIACLFDISLDYLHGLTNEETTYSREQYVILPKSCPPIMKKELLEYLEFLKLKHKIK